MEFVESELLSLRELQSNEEIENLKSQISDLKIAVDSLKHETKDSIASLKQMKFESREVDQSTQRPSFDQHISIVCKELVQRQEKRRNLIIFGLNKMTNNSNIRTDTNGTMKFFHPYSCFFTKVQGIGRIRKKLLSQCWYGQCKSLVLHNG